MTNLTVITKGNYTSLQIAEWTGKEHFNIMVDIRKEVESLSELAELIFQLGTYHDKNNQCRPCYNMTEDGVMQLALKYDAKTRFTVIQKLKENQQPQFKVPQTFKEALLLAVEQQEKIELLEAKIEEEKPLVTFANTVLKSKDNILIRELAKIACDEGIKIGEKRLYTFLREQNMIFSNSTEPYQKYVDNGYFKVKESSVDTPYGIKLTRTCLVTPKGQVKIIEKLREKNQ